METGGMRFLSKSEQPQSEQRALAPHDVLEQVTKVLEEKKHLEHELQDPDPVRHCPRLHVRDLHLYSDREQLRGAHQWGADDDAHDVVKLVQLLQQPMGDDLGGDPNDVHRADRPW